MPKLFPYLIVKGFLDPEFNREIHNYAVEKHADFSHSKTSKRVYHDVDSDQIKSMTLFDIGPLRERMEQKIGELVPRMITALEMSPFEPFKIETELGAYGDGAFFGHHIDTVTIKDAKSYRVISAIYYVNSEPKKYTGGHLRLYPFPLGSGNDEPVDIIPENNSLVIFPSYAPHEVLPVVAPGLEFKDWRFAVNCMVHKE
jgi:SM-20-related protein